MDAHIRTASTQDLDPVRHVHLQAFPETESRQIADLAGRLLTERTDPETLSLVAETSDEVIGHVAFSPVYGGVEERCLGYLLAPLAVKPNCHGAGIGSQLVTEGIARLSASGIDLFLVYGDPNYYGRFGFVAEAALRFIAPYELKYPFGWLAMRRNGGHVPEEPVQLSCVASLRDPTLW